MRNFVLYASSCLSCFIVMTILLEFMDERYQRSFKNKYLYPAVKLGFTVVIAGVNMMNSLEVAFSKVVLIFLYYMVVAGLLRKKEIPVPRLQYLLNFAILLYTLVDIVVIIYNMNNRQENYFLIINLGCIVLADLYLVYLVKIMNEKGYLEYEVKLLEKQSKLQYQYYVRQEQKYNRTVGILHDVNKHMKLVERLCASGEAESAKEYAAQVGNMLQPLVPVKYTGNPILDILLTDRAEIMAGKGIRFDIQVEHVSLDFIDAIDVTTIFGNLLDNAIEACEQVEQEKRICIFIKPYHEMVAMQIKNSCPEVHWKNGWPVSEKNEHQGIGLLNVKQTIEKYDGNMNLKAQDGVFAVDIFLNS